MNFLKSVSQRESAEWDGRMMSLIITVNQSLLHWESQVNKKALKWSVGMSTERHKNYKIFTNKVFFKDVDVYSCIWSEHFMSSTTRPSSSLKQASDFDLSPIQYPKLIKNLFSSLFVTAGNLKKKSTGHRWNVSLFFLMRLYCVITAVAIETREEVLSLQPETDLENVTGIL